MSTLWFTKDASYERRAQIESCWCDQCPSHIIVQLILQQYEEITLHHGQKVTKEIVLKAWAILGERLKVLSGPASLEALAGFVVDQNTSVLNLNQLPLPHIIIENIYYKQYQYEVKKHNFEADYNFHSHISKTLPVILWNYVGNYVITEWDHPCPF